MFYVEVDCKPEDYYFDNGGGYQHRTIATTKLVGPFKYRKDVENYLETNTVLKVIQID